MKKICVFTLYADKGGSSQYRTYIFKEELEKYFDLKWFYFWNNNYVVKYMHNKKKYFLNIIFQYIVSLIKRFFQLNYIAPKCDVIYIQKAIIPKINSTFLKKAKKRKCRIVFDVDDAIYLFDNGCTDNIAKMSDIIICGNNTLKEHYQKLGCKCMILPTVENTFRYKPFWKNTFNNKIIGWIGSEASIHNLELIVKPINELIKKHQEIEFHIICDYDYGYLKKIKNSKLIKWDKERYIKDLSEISIGIMPLKNTNFNQGKCGFKLVQYLNMKKPVIGSDVGVNSDIIKGNGLIADNEMQWINAIESLLYDEKLYNRCCEHIESVFLKEYHFENISKKLINILNRENRSS